MKNRILEFSTFFLILGTGVSTNAQNICQRLFTSKLYQLKIKDAKTMMSQAILGQNDAIDQAFVSYLIRGHVLIEGPPGTGKTRFALSMARIFGGRFSRIQFTNDIMPSNILGGTVRNRETGEDKFVEGPIFTDFLLADEINRGPSKSQSAFLQPMSEGKLAINGVEYRLPKNFFAIATQNPSDQVGTNPLPEAQYDRFTMRILVNHPTGDTRERIASMAIEERMGISTLTQKISQVLTFEELETIQAQIFRIQISPEVKRYAETLFDAIQDPEKFSLSDLSKLRKEGISARGLTDLFLSAKASAWIAGRDTANVDDLKKYIQPVLAHRLLLTATARSEGIDQQNLLNRFIKRIEDMHSAKGR